MAPKFITKIISQPPQQEQPDTKLSQTQILNQLFDQKVDQNSKSRGCITLRGEMFNEEQQYFMAQLTSICDVICLSRTNQTNLPKGVHHLPFQTDVGCSAIVRSLKPKFHIDDQQYENLHNFVKIVQL